APTERRLGGSRRSGPRGSWYRECGMRSRWNDAEASQLNGLDLLVYASRLVGAETSLVIWGGGNTSIKTRERDHRGREIPVLRVKGSGSDLKSVQRKDFPGVRMDDIAALLGRDEMSDEEMVSYLAHALQEPGGVRPSIETLLHGFLSAPAIVHTHADAVVSLTNNDRAHDVIQGVYGKDVIALAYRRPGFRISRDVADAIADRPEAARGAGPEPARRGRVRRFAGGHGVRVVGGRLPRLADRARDPRSHDLRQAASVLRRRERRGRLSSPVRGDRAIDRGLRRRL